jgi:DNA (cytosine-5)-methyltransferase 1
MTKIKIKEKMKAISLFAGCGGDSLGLKKAGFEVVGFVENWSKAIQTHKLNFPKAKLIGKNVGGDITKIPDKEFLKYTNKIDILFAGFPCQGFSHAGKKDIKDQRNKLFWEFVRVTKLIKPKWIIGENVAGLLHRKTDDGKTGVQNVIVKAFEEIGYQMAEPTILKAEYYGIPQKRRRVFFVGNKLNKMFKFPEPKKKLLPIRKIIEPELHNAIKFKLPKNITIKMNKIYEIKKNEQITGKPHPFLLRKLKDGQFSFRKRISPNHVEIVDIDLPTKTIHCGYSFQPRLFVLLRKKKEKFIRPFNTKELAQIQGFPKNYKFFGKEEDVIKQIGNAVPPPLVTKIVEKIYGKS